MHILVFITQESMINIAIVEDNLSFYEELAAYLEKFQETEKIHFSVSYFKNGLEFITKYKPFDIVLMDIEMPYMNGMCAAQKLREVDQKVCLIFITNMAQYAIKGYEVDALAYMLKPIRYIDFSVKLKKAVKHCQREKKFILYSNKGIVQRIMLEDINFVEVTNNLVIFHTDIGEFEQFRTLKSVEQELAGAPFARCNSCYLVNLSKVSGVDRNEVLIGGARLQISRNRKKEFMNLLTMCLGGTI